MNEIESTPVNQDVFPRDELAIKTRLGRAAAGLTGCISLAAGAYVHLKFGHDIASAHWIGAAFDGAGVFAVAIAANEQHVATRMNQQSE